ncbi:DUF1501 domain-containing protein [Sphingorhabdus pulchriflava]|uniref:DUF1501 domain-containing protein n=1 Tax=Sphingorhabdus pulchriflava TaxID=2292257 RepID=A0A371B5Y1_9SPHN|nr:DUF1501 domain-containing protein [Sphingorhabdus pulchriflava]RDV02980.1 DUF1501 domain-containing protein [Sphingorhabdus pulchriflava]
MIDRRRLILSGLAGTSLALTPRFAFATADTDRRFIFIIQRGAADGLGILAPVGDPAFASARGDLAANALSGAKLDGLFALHPQMTASAALFRQKQAAFYHAIASGYRERSHFDGQNLLETAGTRPYGRDDGWINRLLGMLPKTESKALALATAIPPALRGPVSVSSYAPSRLPDADAALMERVAMLYAEDAQLAPLWASAAQTEAMAGGIDPSAGRGGVAAGKMVASLMAGADGARVAMVETGGWDTHINQEGRLGTALKGVDEMIETLCTELGQAWSKTLVLVATEFGRTVHANGTRGTDHGTASAAMLFGGGLSIGGKIVADWPGLADSQLYEGRDLKPTTRFESMVIAALSSHYGIDPKQLQRTVFPDFPT